MPVRLPLQRWQFHPASDQADALAVQLGVSPLIAQILCNRGLSDPDLAQAFLHPHTLHLPSPLEEFPALAQTVELLEQALAEPQAIAICGDYDADGMTSTALLLRALRFLGGTVDYAIPSRMQEGYGLNCRMVEEFHGLGFGLILTVDNGIAAHEAIARARDLGMTVIITDHHDLPPDLPVAHAILNPKLIPPTSPYHGLAGVGVAYLLAISLVQQMGRLAEFVGPLLDLYTIGTIADLAPLTGVNRHWIQQGLARLPESSLVGIQALIEVSGVNSKQTTLRPEDIGFRLGPRINAIGRIGDPEVIIDLLTTDDPDLARVRAEECEATNQERQALCQRIEEEAIALCETGPLDPQTTRVLLLLKADWHHGVIGIVASRLVERYGLPVFIATYENESYIRGSARGIPEFDVFEALEFCKDLLVKHGGHKAAGGFSLEISQFETFQQRLQTFALQTLEPEQLKPLVQLDAELPLGAIAPKLYAQIDSLNPWGIGNPEPLFWSSHVQVLEQRLVGKGHIKLKLGCVDEQGEWASLGAIAWRWASYFPLPDYLDVAYRLRQNTWKERTSIELELAGARLSATWLAQGASASARSSGSTSNGSSSSTAPSNGSTSSGSTSNGSIPAHTPTILDPSVPGIPFTHGDRAYTCALHHRPDGRILEICNGRGDQLLVRQGQAIATLQGLNQGYREVDVRDTFFRALIQSALTVLPNP